MPAKTSPIRRRCLTVCAMAALGLGLTTPVIAQPGYGDYSHDPDTLERGGCHRAAPSGARQRHRRADRMGLDLPRRAL